jgi:hypothetical protein
LKRSSGGRRALKKYEVTNLLFFLTLIVALGILVTFVFRYYGKGSQTISDETKKGVISVALSPGSDVGLFYLGTNLSQTNHQYRNRLEIPVTDDGLLRDLFNLPGVEEITLNQKVLIIKKSPEAEWVSIQAGVRQIVARHLHIHY